MDFYTVFIISSVLAAGGCLILNRFAGEFGLVDHPGGRKDHAAPVPLVGGLAVAFAALCMSLVALPAIHNNRSFLAAAAILIAAGALDDSRDIRPVIRIAVQIVASLIMIFGAGVELNSVGNLAGFGSIGMWVLSVPATVFAVVGVINAVNMIDGEDGLAGTIIVVALGWYGWMAYLTGAANLAMGAIILCGALTGFLVFNLRLPWRPQACVFLGDAGSTLLGFVLAWMAIALTQGPGQSVPPIKEIPPICALWVVLLPLADAVSLIARRLRRGRSSFEADREHIHHLLRALGLTHTQMLLTLTVVSAVFGAVGFFGWRLHVPEPVLFWAFFCLYFAYHFTVKAIWRRLYEQRRVPVPAATPVPRE